MQPQIFKLSADGHLRFPSRSHPSLQHLGLSYFTVRALDLVEQSTHNFNRLLFLVSHTAETAVNLGHPEPGLFAVARILPRIRQIDGIFTLQIREVAFLMNE